MWLQRIIDRMKKRKVQVPYSIRVSPKAKYLRLRIIDGTGLEVVIPKGCSTAKAKAFVQSNHGWIQKNYRNIEIATKQVLGKDCLPDEIILQAINQRFYVRYEPNPSENLSLYMPSSNQLIVQADPDSQVEVCCELLQKWLKNQARDVLVPHAYSLADKYKLPIARVQIRRQKTRWGSMSTSGTLSLNCHLMFLSHEFVQHILIHELCHVLHRNHGPHFKSMLSELSPNSVRLEKDLKRIQKDTIPLWAKV